MRSPTLFVLVTACVAIGALSSFSSDDEQPAATPADSPATLEPQDESSEEHSDAAVVDDLPPHTRAPHNVNLFITEDDKLRAPGEEWFEQQAELVPGRYTYDENLHDVGGWVDDQGVYEFIYDEEEEEAFYWQHVTAAQLTAGRQDYVQFCSSCHGLEGDGYGRSGQHLRPSPRNFQNALFKFTKVTANLPTDDRLIDLVRNGLNGTPMLPWDLSEEQLTDIIQYVKSLSAPETGWRDLFTEIGGVVESGKDPWVGRDSEAIERGEWVYHKNDCHSCHPGYVAPAKLASIRGDAPDTKYRDDLSYPALKDSSYQVLGKEVKIMPPDFTWHIVRSGVTKKDLFETIASGIKGTAMPQWKVALPDEDIWAAAYYVEHLITEYLGQPAKRTAFMNALRDAQ